MGAKRSFREGIRAFCREGRWVMSGRWPRGRGLALDRLIRQVPGFRSHYRDRIPTRRTRSNGMIILSEHLCRDWNEGIRGSRAARPKFWGVPLMRTVAETRFRRAPWGRKKHLLPLPILSVVLMVTVMA